MNLLEQLTIKNLKLNRKRTIVTIIGIILSVALITALASMYTSSISSLVKYEKYEKGDFHYSFYDVPNSDIKTFENNRKIEQLNLVTHLGYSILKDSQNKYKPYAHIMGFSKSALENLSVQLVDGRLPMKDDEIVIPTHLKTNGRVFFKVGDTITLDVGTRVSDGIELNQNNPFDDEKVEEIIGTTTKTYKIVGIIERPASNIESYSAPGYTFITYVNEKDMLGNVDIYARYTKEGLKDQYRVTANILGVDSEIFEKVYGKNIWNEKYSEELEKNKYNFENNSYLISLETNPLDTSSTASLGVVACIVALIIVVTSVFCIKNSFDISITEKIRQYGMLRSVGATKKQIRKNVLFEAFILGLIGIPLGILGGFLAAFILLKISNSFLGDMYNEGMFLSFEFSWISVLVAIVLGILTIYLSAIKSSIKASRISPIVAIRNSGNIKIKAKKLKTPKIISKIFGIGGDISYKNLKRNKKKYRTTVISIIVSCATFIALSSFVDLTFLAVGNEYSYNDYNIALTLHIDGDESIYEKGLETINLDNIKSYCVMRDGYFNVENAKYLEEYVKLSGIDEDESFDGSQAYLTVFAVGEQAYKNYVKELGLNYDEVKNKAILMDMEKVGIDSEENGYYYKSLRSFTYSKGDKIVGKNKGGEKLEFEIADVTDKVPFGISTYMGTMIILSDETFDKFFALDDTISIYYDSSDPDKLQDDIEGVLKGFDFTINNNNENIKMMRNLFTLLAIFLYGFIIVISLIGITNIFNTITTNMELRKPEFASLKSIGMTTPEFNRMIRLESIFMGVKSLFFGVPIGLCLSYLIYHFLAEDGGIAYPLPIKAIIIAVVAVFLLITCIMKYSMGKINQQNTIETIRNENI